MTNSFQFHGTTVLFVQSHPVGYAIYRADDLFHLEPADIPDESIDPPLITVHHDEEKWIVTGTLDQDLIDQVIEDLSTIGSRPVIEKAAPLGTALT